MPASPGEYVDELHQGLIEAGFAIPRTELDAVVYGPGTHKAVQAFQRSRKLTVDGIAGPQTMGALRILDAGAHFTDRGFRVDTSNVSAEVGDVVRAAAAEIGTVEKPPGSNRGPRVDAYTTPHLGAPWCAYFVSWCYRVAGSPFGVVGSAWGLYDWCARRKRVVAAKDARAGDLAIVRRANRRGHVAIVAANLGNAKVVTIGGNESNAVRGRVRRASDFTDFVRPVG